MFFSHNYKASLSTKPTELSEKNVFIEFLKNFLREAQIRSLE